MATQRQIDHMKEHLDEFEGLTGTRDVDGYFHDYHDDDLYIGLCNDLGLEPLDIRERIWIATDSGTWGGASDLVLVDATSAQIDALDEMTDSEIIEFGKEHGVKP